MRTACLTSIAYVLGECELSYREAPGFAAVCAQESFPDMPALFGWGAYHRTDRSLSDLAVESARLTLERSGLSGGDIDALIVCSANFRSDQGPVYADVLRELGLTRASPIGVTWSDCTMLLASLTIAQALVRTRFRNVLVVSANRMEQERFRFQNYALFSDGAASCIVTSEPSRGFEILDGEAMSRWECATREKGAEDSGLYRDAHGRLMARMALRTEQLESVVPNNLFLPLLKIKEGWLGITSRQLFLDNVARVGHCFSADSLINLHDMEAAGQAGVDGPLMLTANADGLRSEMVLRRRG